MDTVILAIGFGEPSTPDRDVVERYLERIFYDNMAIEGDMPEPAARERAATLASRRAPGLIEEYEEIGGSPLMEHLEAHTERLDDELADRGFSVSARIATQYFDPSIEEAIEDIRDDDPELLVALPMYPLCGPSTTVAALRSVEEALSSWPDGPRLAPIGGWHRHPRYNRLRADNVRSFVDDAGVDLNDPDTELVFSAHGTPISYLEAGSRYDTYVEEYCQTQAKLLEVDEYTLGFQNHESRGVDWTEPDIEAAVQAVDASRIVVEPISFIHEQSETLSELDDELAEEAHDCGLEFHRVPVPHDDPELAGVLADLVEPAIADFDDSYYGLRPCQCADTPGTRCLCAPLF